MIALRKILAAVRTGIEQSLAAGLRAEQEAFRDCMATRATQNKVYIACASRRTDQFPELEGVMPVPIHRAAVLGVGTMGGGIAQALNRRRHGSRRLRSESAGPRCGCGADSRFTPAPGRAGQVARRAGRSRSCPPHADHGVAHLASAQLVVEAVFENVEVKRAAIARLEEICPAETIIASNTSTIGLDVLAEGMRRPERLIGMHFFHPAQQMPLVEVVRRRATPPQVIATTLAVVKALRKTPVLVLSREGFIVTRLFVAYLKEAFWLLEEGAEPDAVDRTMTDFGFAMGPLGLIDMSGLDILVFTGAILQRAFPEHGGLSRIAEELNRQGRLGQKTAAGVYRYQAGDHTPGPHEATAELLAAARCCSGSVQPPDAEQIVRRLMLRMVAEAFRVLEEGIVARPADIDVAMVLGTGMPDFRGGVLKYACDAGLDRVLGDLRRLSAECGPRYAPCRLLEEAAARSAALPREGRGEGQERYNDISRLERLLVVKSNQQGF